MHLIETRDLTYVYPGGVTGLDGVVLASDEQFSVAATESRWIAVRVQLPYEGAQPGSHPIRSS